MLKRSVGYSIYIFILWSIFGGIYYFLSGEPDWILESLIFALLGAIGAYLGYSARHDEAHAEGYNNGYGAGYKKGLIVGRRIGYEEKFLIECSTDKNSQQDSSKAS